MFVLVFGCFGILVLEFIGCIVVVWGVTYYEYICRFFFNLFLNWDSSYFCIRGVFGGVVNVFFFGLGVGCMSVFSLRKFIK